MQKSVFKITVILQRCRFRHLLIFEHFNKNAHVQKNVKYGHSKKICTQKRLFVVVLQNGYETSTMINASRLHGFGKNTMQAVICVLINVLMIRIKIY